MDNALSKRLTMTPGKDLGQQLKVSYSIEERVQQVWNENRWQERVKF